MNPDKVTREKIAKLTDLPNIGPAMERDLHTIGISTPRQISDRSPYDMYETLCRITGMRHDPCVLDVFLSITRFMQGDLPKPWWHYTRERKEYLNGSHLFVVTDIFGRTASFNLLTKELSKRYFSVTVVDPYDGATVDFKNEKDAYIRFQTEIGLNGYVQKVSDTLSGRNSLIQTLLGFSVGASAVWAVSQNLSGFTNTRAVCFYSSQIRNFMDISPEIKTEIYFAESEAAYDVNEVMDCLALKNNVKCIQTRYGHGFMNKKSRNFDRQGYAEYLELLNHV